MRIAKTLIRLGGCPGCSESSLSAQVICWFCHAAAQLCLSFQKIEEPFLMAVKETLGDRYSANMEHIYRKTIKFILETLMEGFNMDQ